MGKRIVKSSNRELWLQERKRFVTASSVAAMLDEGKYSSREQLLQEKLGLYEVEENESMWWGAELEEPILKRLSLCPHSRLHGADIRPCGWLYADESKDISTRLAATPDAWWHGNRIEGHKTWEECYSYTMLDEHGQSKDFWATSPKIPLQLKISKYPWKTPPLDYVYQVQCEIACTSAGAGVLVQFHGNMIANIHWIERDEQFITRIRNESVWFMEVVRKELERVRYGIETEEHAEKSDQGTELDVGF